MTMAAPPTFSALSGVQRAEHVLDAGTFIPLTSVTPEALFVMGSGLITSRPVLLALIDGHVRGGTIGLRESGMLARLADMALSGSVRGQRPAALIIGFD